MTYQIYEKTTYYIRCDICEDWTEENDCTEEWFLYQVDRSGWKRNETLSNNHEVDCCPRCKGLSDEEKIRKWKELNRD